MGPSVLVSLIFDSLNPCGQCIACCLGKFCESVQVFIFARVLLLKMTAVCKYWSPLNNFSRLSLHLGSPRRHFEIIWGTFRYGGACLGARCPWGAIWNEGFCEKKNNSKILETHSWPAKNQSYMVKLLGGCARSCCEVGKEIPMVDSCIYNCVWGFQANAAQTGNDLQYVRQTIYSITPVINQYAVSARDHCPIATDRGRGLVHDHMTSHQPLRLLRLLIPTPLT